MTEEEEDAEGAEKIVMWREGEGTKGRGERKEMKEQGGKGGAQTKRPETKRPETKHPWTKRT